MNLALDFDGTYTADPETFDKVIEVFRSQGHKVYVVTMRYKMPHVEARLVLARLQDKVDGIIFTERQAKVPFMELNHPDKEIDWWLDDEPRWLLTDGA